MNRCGPGERWADADEVDYDNGKHDVELEANEQRESARPALRMIRASVTTVISASRPSSADDCEATEKRSEQAEDAADVEQAIPPNTGATATVLETANSGGHRT